MSLVHAIVLSLSYAWGDEISLEAGEHSYAWSCKAHIETEAAPMVLTWSPSEGFGARSDVSVTGYSTRMMWCP